MSQKKSISKIGFEFNLKSTNNALQNKIDLKCDYSNERNKTSVNDKSSNNQKYSIHSDHPQIYNENNANPSMVEECNNINENVDVKINRV